MKNYLSIFILFLSMPSFAQKEWVEEKVNTYSVKYPSSWKIGQSENPGELSMLGPTPDFKGSNEYLGTSLYVSSEDSKYTTIDLAAVAYKKKLLGTDFLKDIVIQKEEKIKFKGVDAVEIIFTAKIQHYASACRIIIFQHNNIYYELSVTYDQTLSEKLMKEAYKVMETFKFRD